MINTLTLEGRLTQKPELKRTNDGTSVCNFSVACQRNVKAKGSADYETDFINCTAWRSSADYLTNYGEKGDKVLVAGRLQINQWTDKEGRKHNDAYVQVEQLSLCGGRRSSDEQHQTSNGSYGGGYSNQAHEQRRSYDNRGYGGEQESMFGNQRSTGYGAFSELTDSDDEELPF